MSDSTATLRCADRIIEESGPDFGPCLREDEIVAFAEGQLGGAPLERVHLHVDRCSTCQHLLNEAAHALAAGQHIDPSASEDRSFNTMFQPGALVARRYRIRRFIDRGSMGEVYEAWDLDLQERVALKTVTSTSCDSPRAVRRLKSEVALARRVGHPNVCRIYDFGTHSAEGSGSAIHFLTMAFVEGQNLGELLRTRGVLSLEQSLEIAQQLLMGLRAAHEAGILHRDFKSHNVLLRTEANGRLTAVILDFGLARALDEDATRLTSGRNHALVGTIAYMAPEQIEGKPLSPKSDIYAFGVVLFEMLTGSLPFRGSSAAANALERLRKPAAPPSSLDPRIPPEVDAVVLRCLSRTPEGRYETAAEVSRVLASLMQTPPEHPRARRYVPLVLALAALAAVVTLAVLNQSAAEQVHAPAQPDIQSAMPSDRADPPNVELAQPPASPLDTPGNATSGAAAVPPAPVGTAGNRTKRPTPAQPPISRGGRLSGSSAPGPAPAPLPSSRLPDVRLLNPFAKGGSAAFEAR